MRLTCFQINIEKELSLLLLTNVQDPDKITPLRSRGFLISRIITGGVFRKPFMASFLTLLKR